MSKNTYTLTIRYRRSRTEVRTYATHAAAAEGFQTVAGNALTLDMILTPHRDRDGPRPVRLLTPHRTRPRKAREP